MKYYLIPFIVMLFISCESPANTGEDKLTTYKGELDTATFAGGCFWCIEASFEQIKGVVEAVSGYEGGSKKDAHYEIVGMGRTKHAETVQIYYDPSVIDYSTLLDIFFTAHDPTQLNRQGPDVGPQYRSAIFYHNDEQKKLAQEKIKELSGSFDQPIVTEVTPHTEFYMAEDYHQDYEKHHPFNPYILNVSKPKINRVRAKFPQLLKDEDM
ncbi:MAG: peptide-methionine (S)-S-oxide reductase MsrA [Bacteroidota bacterium]